MALPTMHILDGSLHAKVVDQYLLKGYAMPGAVLLDGGEAVARAEELGRNVASQIGKGFEEARYLGPNEEGACPYCHLAQIEMECAANKVYCITCGVDGRLEADSEGRTRPRWNEDPKGCFLTMRGKPQHLNDLAITGSKEKKRVTEQPDFGDRKADWDRVDIPLIALPSVNL